MSPDRLPRYSLRSADRHVLVEGDAFVGDVIATFSRELRGGFSAGRASLEGFQLVVDAALCLEPIRPHQRRRDGRYELTLPDGTTLIVSDPAW